MKSEFKSFQDPVPVCYVVYEFKEFRLGITVIIATVYFFLPCSFRLVVIIALA